MKTVLRNLLSVIRRFKLATALNLLGLSVAFTAFLLILMQWNYDRQFDRQMPEGEKVFRVEGVVEGFGAVGILPRPLMEMMEKSPQVENVAFFIPIFGNTLFYVEEGTGKKGFQEQATRVSSSQIADLFRFEMVEGAAKELDIEGHALLPESLARKMFGTSSAVGRRLLSESDTLTVVGVYRDFPRNSTFRNPILYAMDENTDKGIWTNYNYVGYIRLYDQAKADAFLTALKGELADLGKKDIVGNDIELRLTPLADLHYVSDVQFDFTPKASRQTLLVLLAIAVLIIGMAAINFTNFSTALTPLRIKSINTQKVLGGQVGTIRQVLVVEAMLTSFLAFLLSLLWVRLLAESSLAGLLDTEVSLMAHPVLLACTALLSLLTGLLAGLYPAFYMTSFPPALVLKGSFGLSPKGRVLRNVLVSVQFVASFALIVGALFMYLQNRYMQHADSGFDREAVVVTDISLQVSKEKAAFASRMKAVPGVEEVSFSQDLFNASDFCKVWGRSYKDGEIQVQAFEVTDDSFLRLMGIEVEEGRDFRATDALKASGTWIFNRKAQQQFDLHVGDKIGKEEVIGFISDVKITSFRKETEPMGFFLPGTDWGDDESNYAYIKMAENTNLFTAMEQVREVLRSFDADYPFDLMFYDRILDEMYSKELNLTMLITIFSLTAVFISIVGVFGLVVFDSEYRRKEIGVRKVLGSTTGEILVMFNKGYIRILLICFVLAAPMAWYGVSRWLENFAYKTPMYLWVYLVAFLIVALITVCTVTFQNWRAANSNPVDSIKSE